MGLKENDHNPLVLFYTASGGSNDASSGKTFTQCMAVSIDGGNTFAKYRKNPVIGTLAGRTRDPNVAYDKKSKNFIMALYIGDNEYGFFKSKNLTAWEEISRQSFLPERECPDIFPMDDGGQLKWVFCGANNYYIIADLDLENGLVNCSEVRRFGFGNLYAGQTFNGCDKRIRIAWDRLSRKAIVSWDKSSLIPTKAYSGIMSMPAELELKDGILRVKPAFEFDTVKLFKNEKTAGLIIPLAESPLSLKLKISGLKDILKVKIFGNVIVIEKDVLKFKDVLGGEYEMPFLGEVTIFADDIGYEIFSADKYYASYQAISDYSQSSVEFEGSADLDRVEIGYCI